MVNRKILGPALLAGALLLWTAAVLAGTRILLNYENAPGPAGNVPPKWPPRSRILRRPDKHTLVMLLHPNCPCSRATIAELEILEAKLQGKINAVVLFSKPGANEAEVQSSGLWRRAVLIPGVLVRYDKTAFETQQFGGLVSGETAVYDPHGELVFSGGITSGRGHQGDNAGLEDIVAAVDGKLKRRAQAPVFGCPLHNPTTKELSEASWKKP